MLRFIITGSGRSGTGYMSQVLQAMGVMCGHENVFMPNKVDWRTYTKDKPSWDGDSSWLAAPHLTGFKGPVFHIVREPIKVIRSMCSIRVFDTELYNRGSPYSAYTMRHCPEAWEWPEVQDRCAHFICEWNRRIQPFAHTRYRIEYIRAPMFQDILEAIGVYRPLKEVQLAIQKVSKKYNSLGHDFDHLELSDLSDELRNKVLLMMRDYGYSTGGKEVSKYRDKMMREVARTK